MPIGLSSSEGTMSQGSSHSPVTHCRNLWAVGFDTTGRAAEFHDALVDLCRGCDDLVLVDVAVAVRYDDGTFTLNGEPLVYPVKIHTRSLAHLLATLALGAPPLTGAAVGTLLTTIGATSAGVGISDAFVHEVEGLIKPGTSALFVLDDVGNLDAVLPGLRGLGGRVLKTSVDLERAKQIQAALSASAGLDQPEAR
jgi:uncharacterized membrane protein